MKRFLLFAGNDFSPMGGIDDLIMSCLSIDDARKVFDFGWIDPDLGSGKYDWGHILDSATGDIYRL